MIPSYFKIEILAIQDDFVLLGHKGLMYSDKRCKTFCIAINNVLSIVINIENTTIFEPVILTGFYTSL